MDSHCDLLKFDREAMEAEFAFLARYFQEKKAKEKESGLKSGDLNLSRKRSATECLEEGISGDLSRTTAAIYRPYDDPSYYYQVKRKIVCPYEEGLRAQKLYWNDINRILPPLESIPFSFGGVPDKFDVVVKRLDPRHPYRNSRNAMPCGISVALNSHFLGQRNIDYVENTGPYVWCEGPYIGHFNARSARWFHINFRARVGHFPDALIEKPYFAEVIEFHCAPDPAIFKVISCVPTDGIVNVHGAKCVICDCDQICHPSPEFCIADVSSMNPYNFKDWIKAGIKLASQSSCNYFLTTRF